MRQAIRGSGSSWTCCEHYTDYDAYYRLVKTGRGRPGVPQAPRGRRAGEVHAAAPIQPRAEDRSDRGALPKQRAAPHEWPREGDGGDVGAPARRSLHAGASSTTSPRSQYDDIRPLVAFSGTVQRSVHRQGLHRARHEHRRSDRQTDQRGGAAGPVCVARLPDPAGGGEVPDWVSTSRCCKPCTWTNGWTACRQCKRCRGSTAWRRARRRPSCWTS